MPGTSTAPRHRSATPDATCPATPQAPLHTPETRDTRTDSPPRSTDPILDPTDRFGRSSTPVIDSRQTTSRIRRKARRGATAKPASEPRPIDEVWQQYKATGREIYRTRLIVHYMQGHVRRIASRLKATLPSQVDVDDLAQQGYLGLVEAIERFDLDRDVKFETFSSRRISGAMRDYLRQIDHIPRLIRVRDKKIQAVTDSFITEHGRPPSFDEMRDLVEEQEAEFQRMMTDRNPAAMVSFNAAAAESGEHADEGDAMGSFRDRGGRSPLSSAERRDLRTWLTRGLSQRDKMILVLYYYEKMTMAEVGRSVGCSESRVSQRLETIIDLLRARLAFDRAEEEFWLG